MGEADPIALLPNSGVPTKGSSFVKEAVIPILGGRI
jgi:hypothetical protein